MAERAWPSAWGLVLQWESNLQKQPAPTWLAAAVWLSAQALLRVVVLEILVQLAGESPQVERHDPRIVPERKWVVGWALGRMKAWHFVVLFVG